MCRPEWPRARAPHTPPPHPPPESIRLLLEQKRRQVPGLQEAVKDPINSLSAGEGAAEWEATLRSSPPALALPRRRGRAGGWNRGTPAPCRPALVLAAPPRAGCFSYLACISFFLKCLLFYLYLTRFSTSIFAYNETQHTKVKTV